MSDEGPSKEAEPSGSAGLQPEAKREEKLSWQSEGKSEEKLSWQPRDDEGNDDDTEEEEEGPESWLTKLSNFIKTKLRIESEDDLPQVLDEVTVEGIVKYITSGKCKNIITMAGAGISTSAGIPDFRSPESGLYSNLQKYNLPYPEAIFDIEYFKSNPKPFFVLAKELYPGTFTPTLSHYFVKLLHNKGLLLRHYTQNIDTLEHVAGIPGDKVVEAHGTFRTSHCLECGHEYDLEWMKKEIFADTVPACTECSGLVKPDIVFFRESLPSKFFLRSSQDFSQCDLLIIMGTSLTVQPFASLVENVRKSCPRLLINREKVGVREPFMSTFHDMFRGDLRLETPNNARDVAMIGDCDDQCKVMAEKLGWKDDLDELLKGKPNGSSTS